MPFARISDQNVHWSTLGQGARKTLMIHCSLAHLGAWAPLAAELADICSMTVFDMPGHGQSDDWRVGSGEYQDAVTESAAHFVTEPMDLVGHSFGATVALRFAVEHPNLVRTLTLIEPIMISVAVRDKPEVADRMAAMMVGFDRAIAAQDWPLAAKEFTKQFGDGRPWDSLPAATQKAISDRVHLIAEGAGGVHHDTAGVLKPGRLNRVTAPVLLIQGSQAAPVMPVIIDGLSARLPNSTAFTIEGAGHMAPITHPQETAAHMKELFSRVPLK